jgi:hypothetical protein
MRSKASKLTIALVGPPQLLWQANRSPRQCRPARWFEPLTP